MRIYCVDAFTDKPFAGAPAAVVALSVEKPDGWMQALAMEMNLSETAFVLPRNAGGYGLRWFTPTTEVDLCGHATLAAAHVLWCRGEISGRSIVFHTRSGELTASKTGDSVELDFPRIDPELARAPDGLLVALGVENPVGTVRAGPDYLVEVESETVVAGLCPDIAKLAAINMRGCIVTARGAESDFVSRFFAPPVGIDEDPVTGSAHCALGPYWSAKLGKSEFYARQLSLRGGSLRLRLAGGRVILIGRAVIVWEGKITV